MAKIVHHGTGEFGVQITAVNDQTEIYWYSGFGARDDHYRDLKEFKDKMPDSKIKIKKLKK